jgi:hypothetical protein
MLELRENVIPIKTEVAPASFFTKAGTIVENLFLMATDPEVFGTTPKTTKLFDR